MFSETCWRKLAAQACAQFQVDADGAAQPRGVPTTFDLPLVTGATSGGRARPAAGRVASREANAVAFNPSARRYEIDSREEPKIDADYPVIRVRFVCSFFPQITAEGVEKSGTDARFSYEGRQNDEVCRASHTSLERKSPGSTPGGAIDEKPYLGNGVGIFVLQGKVYRGARTSAQLPND